MQRQKSFETNNAKLYLVATPIGNLEDITIRAINTLKMVDIIYCEDTRTSKTLLEHYEITTKLKSVHLFNENEVASEIIQNIKEGLNVAIISDAGLPIISDPGWVVVRDAIKENLDVVVIPGASAGISALVASGLVAHDYYFVGFLNAKSAKRKLELKALYQRKETIVFYESPHRIKETLEMLAELYPNRQMVLARELTKKHEEYLRGTPSEILEVVDTLKGEMVIILEGNSNPLTDVVVDLNSDTLHNHYQYYIDKGLSDKDAIKQVAVDRGISKRDVYQEIKR